MPQDAGTPDPSRQLPQQQPSREPNPIAGRIEGPLPVRAMPVPTPPPPPGLSASPDVMSLLAGLRKRWISAVMLGGMLAAMAAVGVFYLMTPKNNALAQIRVAWVEPGMAQREIGNAADFKTYLQTTASE